MRGVTRWGCVLDDVLEMANADLVPMTVAEDKVAQYWAEVLRDLQSYRARCLQANTGLSPLPSGRRRQFQVLQFKQQVATVEDVMTSPGFPRLLNS